MDIFAENYTAAELKAWLRQLELPTNGSKSALALRINEVAPEKRGECPINLVVDNAEHVCVDVGDAASVEISQDKKELEAREADILQREKELLERENALLRRTIQLEISPTVVRPESQLGAEGQRAVEVPIETLRNLVPDYDGSVDPDVWVTQFKNVLSMYTVDEKTIRVLFLCKLKGKAQQWLHSKPFFATEPLERLIAEMQEIFQAKETRLVRRQKFESRKWKRGESFAQYYNDKVVLAGPLQLEEDELVEYLVDGIPDDQLRVQAHLQCYTSKAKLLQAFSKIELKFQNNRTSEQTVGNKQRGTPIQVREIRCYNCNSRGHFAADCEKPKREMGACYACGSMGHKVAACPDRKKTVHVVDDEYIAS